MENHVPETAAITRRNGRARREGRAAARQEMARMSALLMAHTEVSITMDANGQPEPLAGES